MVKTKKSKHDENNNGVEDSNDLYIKDIYDSAEVMNALDDTCRQVLVERLSDYKQSHFVEDLKLGLSGFSVGLALVALVYGYFVAFPKCRLVLAVCSGGYFVILSITSVLMHFLDDNQVVTLHKEKSTYKLRSTMARFSSKYSILLRRFESGKLVFEHDESFDIGNYIHENGLLAKDLLTQLLNSVVDESAKIKKVQ